MTTAAPVKRCSKCQKDLTGAKRLKDAKGQYWCPECGVGDTSGTSSGVGGLMSTCPKCKQSVHATHLVRDAKTGTYVCESCAAGIKAKGKGKGTAAAPASDEEAAKKKKLILAACLAGAGAVAYVVMNYVL